MAARHWTRLVSLWQKHVAASGSGIMQGLALEV